MTVEERIERLEQLMYITVMSNRWVSPKYAYECGLDYNEVTEAQGLFKDLVKELQETKKKAKEELNEETKENS